ncbi:MAG: GHMP kinase [Thermoplasmata archaeon]|nr:MAG: GHMP kinase [Thermoplasmata archaeon]
MDVRINGEEAPPASTSRRVVDFLIGTKPCEVEIDIELELPISQGLGMSGAGALGTAIALDKALKLETDKNTLVGYAHRAEVEARTGLGDVVAQSIGGLELRTKPGAPPFGGVEVMDWHTGVLLVIFSPPLSTRRIITSPEHQGIINALGSELIAKFQDDRSGETFAKLARDFTLRSGLASEPLLEALKAVPEGYGAGMAMLGNCLFITGESAHKLAPDFEPLGECILTEVENNGAFQQITD